MTSLALVAAARFTVVSFSIAETKKGTTPLSCKIQLMRLLNGKTGPFESPKRRFVALMAKSQKASVGFHFFPLYFGFLNCSVQAKVNFQCGSALRHRIRSAAAASSLSGKKESAIVPRAAARYRRFFLRRRDNGHKRFEASAPSRFHLPKAMLSHSLPFS